MRKIATAIFTVLFVVLGTATVQAHADLTSSNPADGSALSAPPSVVELTFSEELLPDTVEVAISTETQGVLPNSEYSTAGNTVQIPWDANLPADTYTVAYRVVSNDGHPITGSLSFSYESTMNDPATEESPQESSEVISVEETTVQERPESTGISPIWIAIVGLLIGVGIGYVMWRRGAKKMNN